MPDQDPRLRAALANADRETADAVSSLRSMTASIREEHEQFKKERDKRREERGQGGPGGRAGPRHAAPAAARRPQPDHLGGRPRGPRQATRARPVARDNARRNIADLAAQPQADPEYVEETEELRRGAGATRAEREV